MTQHSDVSTTGLQRQANSRSRTWRLVQTAPGPEAPEQSDHAARQKGMAIIIGAGVTFWGSVGGLAWYLINR
jgi:hypothetical protein